MVVRPALDAWLAASGLDCRRRCGRAFGTGLRRSPTSWPPSPTTISGFFPHVRHKVPRTWGAGRITVIGDAAHSMPPTRAQGATRPSMTPGPLAAALANQEAAGPTALPRVRAGPLPPGRAGGQAGGQPRTNNKRGGRCRWCPGSSLTPWPVVTTPAGSARSATISLRKGRGARSSTWPPGLDNAAESSATAGPHRPVPAGTSPTAEPSPRTRPELARRSGSRRRHTCRRASYWRIPGCRPAAGWPW